MTAAKSPNTDRVALVTGSSRNIGRAIAVALAKNGINVVVHAAQDQSQAEQTLKQLESYGVNGMVTLGDLSEPDTAIRIMKEVIAKFGRLDILVNNAAIRPESPIADISYAEWRKVMGVCLDAVFLMSQAALHQLRQSTQGTIINIGGLTAHTGASNRAHVISAKAGVVGFTKALASELSPEGITVNCIAPGLIETIRDENNRPHHHATRTNLLGRRGQPEEIAEAVVFLAGASARYITGQTVHINGGAYLP
ncbi:MAG: 3-oxoacyl-ACP reductase family protein [Pseudohongiellaceae bacterium]|jgi:3-oxoacyl-[acyl-carrier protein] reductase